MKGVFIQPQPEEERIFMAYKEALCGENARQAREAAEARARVRATMLAYARCYRQAAQRLESGVRRSALYGSGAHSERRELRGASAAVKCAARSARPQAASAQVLARAAGARACIARRRGKQRAVQSAEARSV